MTRDGRNQTSPKLAGLCLEQNSAADLLPPADYMNRQFIFGCLLNFSATVVKIPDYPLDAKDSAVEQMTSISTK